MKILKFEEKNCNFKKEKLKILKENLIKNFLN